MMSTKQEEFWKQYSKENNCVLFKGDWDQFCKAKNIDEESLKKLLFKGELSENEFQSIVFCIIITVPFESPSLFYPVLFKKCPQLVERCNWDMLNNLDWLILLEKYPQFADKFDKWDEFDGEDWSCLLCEQPQFADKCDKWDEIDSEDWVELLCSQPQFADKCNKWEELDEQDWANLLSEKPQFADKCNWDSLKGIGWCRLLSTQPQFADKCDWTKLDSNTYHWFKLLQDQPHFADKCNKWAEFNEDEKEALLDAQPHLTTYFPQEEKVKNKILTVKQDDSSIVVCIDGKLNFSHSYCFHKDKKDADNESIDFLRHVIETLPPDKSEMLITNGIEVDIKDNELCATIEKELGLKLYNIYGCSGNSSEFEDDESEEIGEKISAEEFNMLFAQSSQEDISDYWKIFCSEHEFENTLSALNVLFHAVTEDDIPILTNAIGLHSGGIIFDYAYLFNEHPEYIQKCNWNMLNGREWQNLLLCGHLEFSDKCDWSKLEACDWSELLADHPQFADKCDKWNDFDGSDWWYLVEAQEQFADKCDWSKLTPDDWWNLLRYQPQFADKCNKWNEFDACTREMLIEEQPTLSKYFQKGITNVKFK